MDYLRLYNTIIIRAKLRLEIKGYTELHHIIPLSLNGTWDEYNLVRLTAREHFICHYLLTRIYPINSKERFKMIKAFWMMKSSSINNQRFNSSRLYEKLKSEYSELLSKYTVADGNSMYGRSWYTNSDDGSVKPFYKNPGYPWYKGRNLFKGETSDISNYFIKKSEIEILELKAFELWDKFHKGNYKSLREFSRDIKPPLGSYSKLFFRFITKFCELQNTKLNRKFKSDITLVGVYK